MGSRLRYAPADRLRHARVAALAPRGAGGGRPAVGDAALAAADALQIPVGLAAVAVVYNVPGRRERPAARRAHAGGNPRRHGSRAGTTRRSHGSTPGCDCRRRRPRSCAAPTPRPSTQELARYSGATPSAGRAVAGERAVAAAVAATPGGVGYLSQAYARQLGLSTAWLRNTAGEFVAPTIAATTVETARAAQYAATPTRRALPAGRSTQPAAASGSSAAYPVVSRFYFVVPRDVCRASTAPRPDAKRTADVVFYVLGGGQLVLLQMDNTPLPSQVAADAGVVAGRLRCDGRKL